MVVAVLAMEIKRMLNPDGRLRCIGVVSVLGLLLAGGFGQPGLAGGLSKAAGVTPACRSVTAVEGEYHCSGECVVRGSDNDIRVVAVSGEVDVLSRVEGATQALYQNEITAGNNFRELEIGTLSGRTLRTATAQVSDGHYPVLEEYIFDYDVSCAALGFTKIVRNPSQENFKACSIDCVKQ